MTMSTTANGSYEYLKSTVLTAPPEQLHLMLLDGAIRFATRGIDALKRKDIEGAFNAFERAQRIVIQMSDGLRRDVNPTLVDQMAALYHFIYRRLVDANMLRACKPAEEALQILRHQRETWQLVIQKLGEASGPPAAAPATATTEAPGATQPSLSIQV